MSLSVKKFSSIERKMFFSNAITLTNNPFLCITEFYLTHAVAGENLLFKNYKVFRSDRKSTSMPPSHGGVLLAVRKPNFLPNCCDKLIK